jgi:dihydropyrimidinase
MGTSGNCDLLIRGGTVVLEDGPTEADIAIEGEAIRSIHPRPALVAARRILEADGCFVLPGSIDTHTHIQWPWEQTSTADTFEAASEAAVASGTTTVIDFVPMARGSSALAAAERRLRAAEGRMAVDYSFHSILNSSEPSILAEVPELIRLGIASFKMYTTYAENRVDDGDALCLIETIAAHGGLPGFHAENDEVIRRASAALVARGSTDIAHFPQSRPAIAESEAVSMVALFARQVSSPVFIFHVSGAPETLRAMADAREAGGAITGETCPHYLVFDDSVFLGKDPWRFLITPPIRAPGAADRLWMALRTGLLSAVGSDHCAYPRADKRPAATSFLDIPAGGPGIETRFPVVLSEVIDRRVLSLRELALATATHPAQVLGLYPRKGVIRPGSDADLTIVDPTASWSLPPDYGGTTDYSLYAGRSLRGSIRSVVHRGAVAAANGRFVGKPGRGQFIARKIEPDMFTKAVAPRRDLPLPTGR